MLEKTKTERSFLYRSLIIGLLLFGSFCLAFVPTLSTVFADPLPDAEVKALNDYPNWVGTCGSSGATTSPTTISGGVAFDDSQSSDTGTQTTVDDDGIDPSPTGSSDHQSSTSYADGQLGALHTNYIALNPGWASANGLVLGDVAALTYKGTTIYAVYGDNHAGDTVHAEISVKADMALKGISDPTKADNLSGVHYVVFPGTHSQLAGSVDQSKIDQIGAASAGVTTGTPVGSGCCSSDGSGGSTTLTGSSPGEQVFNYFISKGLTNIQAAAFAGNFQQESGFSTTEDTGTYYGLAQWGGGRRTGLEAKSNYTDLAVQLDYAWEELQGGWKTALDKVKSATSLDDAVYDVVYYYEGAVDSSQPRGVQDYDKRLAFAQDWLNKAGGGAGAGAAAAPSSDCSSPAGGDADLQKTITVSTPGKFITLPSHYSCPGRTTQIDSRLAADIAYLSDHYNLCADDGLASGHLSHGAGVAVDMQPRNGNTKDDWKNSAEAAARDMGWYGDSADDPQGSQPSCANYGAGDYGQCMHEVHPDKFPQWLRWLGYNGAYDHGDPWHIYGTTFAHIHIGWDTPNHDGVSPVIIDTPRQSVYAFPAPVPDDLKNLID